MSVEFGGVALRFGVAAAAFCACLLNYGSAELFVGGTVAVILNELTHLLLMRYFGCGQVSVDVLPGGVRMHSEDLRRLGYRQTCAVYLAAPAGNLLAGGILIGLHRWIPSSTLFRHAVAHLALGCVNLLPMSFLDGGRALICLMNASRALPDSGRMGQRVNYICLFLLLLVLFLSACRRIFPLPLYVFLLYCAVMVIFLSKAAASHRKRG